MITHTCISKKYILNANEEAILTQAIFILDELSTNSQKDGVWKVRFQKASDDLEDLLDELVRDEVFPYWRDEVNGGSITVQE